MAMSGHERPGFGLSIDWETPPYILTALGDFDDDPCRPDSIEGFMRPWRGRVWLNPPYNRDIGMWLEKLADHGNGIALIFARTETRAFQRYVWDRANALLFLSGRLKFFRDGREAKANSGAPSVLIAYGEQNAHALGCSGLSGVLVTDWRRVGRP